jgi:hypothetical protein
MARVQSTTKAASLTTSTCAKCGADVSKARKFPASQVVGKSACCIY